MPIRSDLRQYYTGRLWKLISQFVRFVREEGRCQNCGRKHGQLIHKHRDGRVCEDEAHWKWPDGSPAPFPDLIEWEQVKTTVVVLQTAHRNHDPKDRSDENLASWCQRCHLEHDRRKHIENAKRTIRARKASGDLFDPPDAGIKSAV